jgi:uncharacterized membrane protein
VTSPYLWLKVAHIVSVTAWLGGALALTVISTLFDPGQERRHLAGIAAASNFVGGRIVAPAGMLTLVTGIFTVWLGKIGTPFWIWWGVGSTVVILAIGIGFLKRGLERMGEMLEDPKVATGEVAAMATRLRRVALVVLVLMVSTVTVMVFKPGF